MRKKQIVISLAISFIIGIMALTGCQKQEASAMSRLDIQGDMSGMNDKSDVRTVSILYSSEENTFEGFGEIKLQGNSSLVYEKKNYTLKLFEDEDCVSKMKVDLGWGEESKYCLKANWIDKTHARNIVTAKLISQVQQKYAVLSEAPCNGVIDGFPIEIYINDEFHGIYTWNIPKDEWMFGMDSSNPNHIAITGEGWEPTNLFREEPNLQDWEVEVGEESEETVAKIKRLFDFVMYSSDEEFKANLGQYLDKDATLNYFILTEFAFLRDNRGKNMILLTYDGQKWYPSLYDLDTSWGTDWKGTEIWDYDIELVDMAESYLWERVEACFGNELKERYFELREDILTKEHIMEEFENFEALIPEKSRDKEVKRWGNEIPGYDISQIEEYLDAVIADWDQRYNIL